MSDTGTDKQNKRTDHRAQKRTQVHRSLAIITEVASSYSSDKRVVMGLAIHTEKENEIRSLPCTKVNSRYIKLKCTKQNCKL